MVNSKNLIGTTEYLTLLPKCRIKRDRYNRAHLLFQLLNTKHSLVYPIMFKLTKVFVMYYEFSAWKRDRIAAVLQTG
jgi:hypothetical protein